MLSSIANTFSNCFKIPELKSRILFTMLVLAVCRLAAYIRIPGLDGAALQAFFDDLGKTSGGSVLGLYSLFTGGAMENCAVGALGIMPYISATIVIQLLTAVVPQLSKLAREEGGRVKIIKYSRYLTVLICIGQGTLMTLGWEHPQSIPGFSGFHGSLVMAHQHLWWYRVQTVLILTTSTLLMMWLGEQITERGIGNGVSLVITIGILARLPAAGRGLVDMFFPAGGQSTFNIGHAVLLIGLLVLVIGGVIAVTQAQRKIPVQYAQRAVGRKIYSGGTQFLPLRLNFAGVMPIIFAGAILMFPQQICTWAATASPKFAFLGKWAQVLNEGTLVYISIYGLMILFFSYFWTATQFNELQIADDLKKGGGYIPGVRPGQATAQYLHRSMSRITFAGALFLTIIAVIPIIMSRQMRIPYQVSAFFGGTSMLINVGVLLDTMRQMESHLLMRHYDGFLSGGRGGRSGPRLRGRL
ncbi:MAG TPA: preprotein translocase subunit SecY [Verrucomicrobiae bacterium]|jgi:preprotein translocase subunit SecY|nr:preprotein translocase subunit SecY [Verrucomicrobiae bacterium]